MHHALEIPWALTDEFKEQYPIRIMKGGLAFYTGALLPGPLRPFACEDFSLGRWMEDERNATVLPPEREVNALSLMPHQIEAQLRMQKAYDNGCSGFLLSDKQGMGKNLSSLAGVTAIAQQEGFGEKHRAKVLIVSSKAELGHWRKTVHQYPISTVLCRFLVIPFNKMGSLLMAPPQARIAKKGSIKNKEKARHGVPTVNWDFIIFDDAHTLREYPRSIPALEATALGQLNLPYVKGQSTFVVFNTPSPGSSPLDFSVMSNVMAPLMGSTEHVGPKDWPNFLKSKGFAISDGRYGPLWAHYSQSGKTGSGTTHANYLKEREKALRAMKRDTVSLATSLRNENAPFLMRQHTVASSLPLMHYSPLPLNMPGQAKVAYQKAWLEFRSWLNQNPKRDADEFVNKREGFVSASSLARTPELFELILSRSTNGERIAVRCVNEREVENLTELLTKKGMPVAMITKTNGTQHLKMWDDFQESEAIVLLYTVMPNLGEHFTPYQEKFVTFMTTSPLLYNTVKNEIPILVREGQRGICYIPYYVHTWESQLTQDIREESFGGDPIGIVPDESFLRNRAARSIQPNRWS